jgi:hypothetical protein
MDLIDFVSLGFDEQMAELKPANLKYSFTLGDHEISLYQVDDFFVEIKRKSPGMQFEKMVTMHFEDLPAEYKSIILQGHK